MQFDELCAAFGALRDRVAELEAKEAARVDREAGGPAAISLSLPGACGNTEIQAMVAKGVQAGLTAYRNRLAP